MKKTIATLAILASSTSAIALIGPGPRPQGKTVCVKSSQEKDRSINAGFCDESANNEKLRRSLKDNGCAAGQIALHVSAETKVNSCMPAGMVQL